MSLHILQRARADEAGSSGFSQSYGETLVSVSRSLHLHTAFPNRCLAGWEVGSRIAYRLATKTADGVLVCIFASVTKQYVSLGQFLFRGVAIVVCHDSVTLTCFVLVCDCLGWAGTWWGRDFLARSKYFDAGLILSHLSRRPPGEG